MIDDMAVYIANLGKYNESYVSYFTVNAIVGELDFPSSEIF